MASAKEEITSQLRREILMLERAPGTPIDEMSLCRQFAVSRTPLREILRQLAGEGYVHLTQNKGAVVAPMDPKSMRNFFLTAPMIYASISRLAAQTATIRDIDDLFAIQKDFKSAVEAQHVESLVTQNERFHYKIGEMADNAYLMPSLQRLLMEHARIGQTFWQSGPDGPGNDILEASRHHDRFIDIFASHDEEAAVALTMAHWELSKNNIDAYIRPAPLLAEWPEVADHEGAKNAPLKETRSG